MKKLIFKKQKVKLGSTDQESMKKYSRNSEWQFAKFTSYF